MSSTGRRRDSRALIVTAARAEFAEQGYAGARVERIARRAGVNKQLIFYYFQSKAGLYQSIVQDVAGDATAPPTRSSAHAAGELREAFGTLFDLFHRRPELARLILLEAPRAQGRESEVAQGTVRAFRDQIEQVITRGQRHGFFRDDVDPANTALQALVLGLGYVVLQPVMESPPDPGRAHQWRNSAAELLLRALVW